MIGRYEPISSHVASPACEKECRNVLLPAFWSPRSRKVKALEPRAQTLENGEESGTISSTSSSCRSGWVNEGPAGSSPWCAHEALALFVK